ncbi:hypothetical protein D3C77_516570 [compost metagenome]
MTSQDVDVSYIAHFGDVSGVGGVDDLCVAVRDAVEQSFLDVGMDVRFWFLDQEEVGHGHLFALVFELEQLERQVDEVGPAQAQLMNRAFIPLF